MEYLYNLWRMQKAVENNLAQLQLEHVHYAHTHGTIRMPGAFCIVDIYILQFQ